MLHAGRGGVIRRMTAAQSSGTPGTWDSQSMGTQPAAGTDVFQDQPGGELLAPLSTRAQAARRAAQGPPRAGIPSTPFTPSPTMHSSGAGCHPIDPSQDDDDVTAVAPVISAAKRQPPAKSRGRPVTRVQQNRRTSKVEELQQQQQATASAWDYPQQPLPQRQRSLRKEVVDLSKDD